MFLIVRNVLTKILPLELKYWLVRNLAGVGIFFDKNLRGVALVADTDKEFYDLYKKNKKLSLLDVKKAYFLHLFAKETSHLSGSIAELGVYRGAGSRIIYEALESKKKFYLFDSWEGLPKTDAVGDENWKEGELQEADIDEVKKLLYEDDFIFIKGFFPQCLETFKMPEDEEFSFIHLDMDLYTSTKDALIYFYPRMQKGGMILIDDYEVKACAGVQKAVKEFLTNKNENSIPLFTGQGLIIKQ